MDEALEKGAIAFRIEWRDAESGNPYPKESIIPLSIGGAKRLVEAVLISIRVAKRYGMAPNVRPIYVESANLDITPAIEEAIRRVAEDGTIVEEKTEDVSTERERRMN